MSKRKEPELNLEFMAASCLDSAKSFYQLYRREMLKTIHNTWIGSGGELCILDGGFTEKAIEYYIQYYNAMSQYRYWKDMIESEVDNA